MSKLRSIGMTIVTIVVIVYILSVTGRKVLTGYLLRRDAVQTRAVIIDEENYIGSKPLSPNRSYSYRFYVNGRHIRMIQKILSCR